VSGRSLVHGQHAAGREYFRQPSLIPRRVARVPPQPIWLA
jgi:hypothetical protein